MRVRQVLRLLLAALALAASTAHAVVTLSESPTVTVPGAVVTAAWAGIVTPTSTDWIALYVPSAANTSYISYRYATNSASGSVPFTLPGGLAVGTYELRLLYNNGYTVLATSNTFTVGRSISGTVTLSGSPLAGVTFAATNGGVCNVSNASGQYSCSVPNNWSGSISASLTGYSFTPASRSYTNVTANQTAQTYTAAVAYQVSGTVMDGASPVAGVAFAGTNGATCTSSNASGQYSCNVPPGWSGSVTPTLASYTFTPASRSYSNVTSAQPTQDYTALPFVQVSGTVTLGGSPQAGVAVAATNGVTCTSSNGSGQYSCSAPQGWSGDVAPSLAGHIFSPASRNYSSISTTQSAQDFTAIPVYQVSGTVSLNGIPLPSVAMGATSGVTCSPTNASGQFSCAAPAGWSGSVTPSATGYTFTPVSRSYSSLPGNQTAQTYAAAVAGGADPIYFIHVDHLNTPRAVYDANQQLRWKWEQQEPFGVNVSDENPAALGAFEFSQRFPGQYFDKETNLHYNYFRDYDPSLGRYGQSDPIGFLGGLNTYAYVMAEPLSLVDPVGLASGGANQGGLIKPKPKTLPFNPLYGPQNCSHYDPDSMFYSICSGTPNNPNMNCARKCLQVTYPGKGASGLASAAWLVPIHPICWWECGLQIQDFCK